MHKPTLLRRARHLPILWWSACLAVALIAGVAVASSVSRAESAADRYTDVADVYVATNGIEQGASIAPGDFELQKWPTAFVPLSAALDGDPEGRPVSRNIEAGEVLNESNVAPGGAGRIAGQIGPDERGIAIRAASVAPNAEKGDRVDVVATYDDGPSSTALVLATRARVVDVAGETVTVSVPTIHAPAVASAAAKNQLTLAISGVSG